MSTRASSRAGRAAALLLACSACTIEAADSAPSAFPSAGLYTPGNLLGASDPSDTPMPGAGLGDRCIALPPAGGAAATAGTLEVAYKTQTMQGRYAPRNCTAVWIETAQAQYVATLELGAGLRRPGLVYFQDHACTEKLGPDAVTSATLPDHDKAHKARWNGVDFEDKPVADGAYKLFIEVTESDKEPGELSEFEFTKSAAPFAVEAPVDVEGPLLEVTLTWKVDPEGSAGGAASAN